MSLFFDIISVREVSIGGAQKIWLKGTHAIVSDDGDAVAYFTFLDIT